MKCLHCVVRDAVIDDFCDDEIAGDMTNSQHHAMQGAALGQALGDLIGLDADDTENLGMVHSERYLSAKFAVAAFAKLMVISAKIEIPAEGLLMEAAKLVDDLAVRKVIS